MVNVKRVVLKLLFWSYYRIRRLRFLIRRQSRPAFFFFFFANEEVVAVFGGGTLLTARDSTLGGQLGAAVRQC